MKFLKKQMATRLLIPDGANLKEEGKNMKFVIKQGASTLMTSTIPFFVKHLLDPQISNFSTLAYGLFLHHKLFMETEDLLEALLLRWRDKNGQSGTLAVKERERYIS